MLLSSIHFIVSLRVFDYYFSIPYSNKNIGPSFVIVLSVLSLQFIYRSLFEKDLEPTIKHPFIIAFIAQVYYNFSSSGLIKL